MRPCFYVLPACTAAQKERLRAAAGALPTVFRDECGPEEREAAFRAAQVIFGEPRPERLADAENLRWIQMTWAGADRYTKAADTVPAGLRISCATGAYGGVIAEYAVGGLLALYRQFPQYVRRQERAVWQPLGPVRRLSGAVVLILGAGDIGTETARRLRPFGASLLGVRRTVRERPPEFDEMHALSDLPELLPRADAVVCSLPGTPETRGLLDEAALRSMKPDAALVNVGRGTLVNPDVLADVLRSGHLLGAVLDVCEPEPLPPEHPLWRMENVLLTPHVAGVGFGGDPETADRLVDLCCDNLRRFLAGGTPRNLIDFETGYRAL